MKRLRKLDSTAHSIGAILLPKRLAKRSKSIMRFAICLIFVCALWRPVFAANVSVPFREIYDLLRTNLAGVSEAQLDHAAAAGLIEHLRPKVTVADAKDEAASAETNGP